MSATPPIVHSAFEWECQQQEAARIRALERDYNIIHDLSELTGWQVTELRRWKPGVVQYRAFRKQGAKVEQIIGYAKDEAFAAVQLPPDDAPGPARPWVGKLHHSRELCDDWGFIRDEAGKLILRVAVAVPHEQWAEHRQNNTDPTQPIVDAVLAALNRTEAPPSTANEPTPAP